ncbi:hypothetical protein SNEBB_001892 [Seison nebaliae]|nr:hypothetical protein SNEBB_001892 [Seison nebaliae]
MTSTKKPSKDKEEDDELKNAPHTLVIRRGAVGSIGDELIHDLRLTLSPFTAIKLEDHHSNSLKDFVSISGFFHITHTLMLSRKLVDLTIDKNNSNNGSIMLRLARMPRGPTISFKVKSFCLIRHVTQTSRRPQVNVQLWQDPPFLVMKDLNDSPKRHLQLTSTLFEKMFPAINIHKINLKEVKRCILINYNEETDEIELRQYAIKLKPLGYNRNVKKLLIDSSVQMARKEIPDLSKFDDISQFLTTEGGYGSESEFEDDEKKTVKLNRDVRPKLGEIQDVQTAIKLREVGPRLNLEIFKIEEGLCDGETLYHSKIEKTKEEIEEMRKRTNQRKSLKEARRKEQERRVTEKLKKKKELRDKQLATMAKKNDDVVKNRKDILMNALRADKGTKSNDQIDDDDDNEADNKKYVEDELLELQDKIDKEKQKNFNF